MSPINKKYKQSQRYQKRRSLDDEDYVESGSSDFEIVEAPTSRTRSITRSSKVRPGTSYSAAAHNDTPDTTIPVNDIAPAIESVPVVEVARAGESVAAIEAARADDSGSLAVERTPFVSTANIVNTALRVPRGAHRREQGPHDH